MMTDQPRRLSAMRRVIGKRLTESKQQAPHFYVTVEADVSRAAAMREQATPPGSKAPWTYTDLLVRATGLALREVPQVNSRLEGETVIPLAEANVGVAVAIEDGLRVPVVRQADRKSLAEVSAEARQLIAKAKAGPLRMEEMAAGSITLSNLGQFGVENFIAIINPPQSAILAVGAIAPRAVVRDGELAVAMTIKMTVSADHRLLDGVSAAQFLQAVKAHMENPEGLL